MTELEWLACSDPSQMYNHLAVARHLDERKLRLFAVACARRVSRSFVNPKLEVGLTIAELYADGLAIETELNKASKEIDEIVQALFESIADISTGDHNPGFQGDRRRVGLAYAGYLAAKAASIATSLSLFDIMRDVTKHVEEAVAFSSLQSHSCSDQDYYSLMSQIITSERHAIARLVREIFGNPFVCIALESSCLTSAVVGLARHAYHCHSYGLLPVLADALEEAGCTRIDLLSHLRCDHPHARGCWALDLLLVHPQH